MPRMGASTHTSLQTMGCGCKKLPDSPFLLHLIPAHLFKNLTLANKYYENHFPLPGDLISVLTGWPKITPTRCRAVSLFRDGLR